MPRLGTIRFRERVVMIVHHHLQIEKTREEQAEHHQDERGRNPEPHPEPVQFALGVPDLYTRVDVELRHGPGQSAGAAATSAAPT
jgi:hypothetical protein